MKKAMVILSAITVIGLTGCLRTEIEKAPVVVSEETNSEIEDDNSEQAEKPTLVTIEIEGEQEEINGLLHAGDGYEIVYDSERFEYSDKDGADSFMADNADPAIYPYIYVYIDRIEDKSASAYVKTLSDTLSANGLKTEIITDAAIGNYKGTILTAQAGSEWNSIIRNYYIVENGTSIYVIEAQYFVEAAEGYGARIQAMLDTFKMK